MKVERAHPVELRSAIEVANEMLKIGVLFVAMPVLNEEDKRRLQLEQLARLDQLEAACEE